MNKRYDYIPETPLKWGQQGAMIILAAFAAVYAPVWLLYVGLARFAWCVLGGQPGRGLVSLICFAVAYVGVAWPK